MTYKHLNKAVLIAFGIFCAGIVNALTELPAETFDTAATGGWQAGPPHPSPPGTDVDCGNQGTGDGCLRIRSLSVAGPGSRLGAFNDSDRWTGDYLGAGITAIRMYARNAGFQDLNLRLRFQGAGGNFITRQDMVLPTNGSGQTFSFSIAPEDLEPFDPVGAAATLQDTFRVWIFHNPFPSFPPTIGPYSVAIDDLTAVAGPVAPQGPTQAIPSMHGIATGVLVGLTLLLGLAFVRRRQAKQ